MENQNSSTSTQEIIDDNSPESYENSAPNPSSYFFTIPIWGHILLLIFTLGIYFFVWIYKTTQNTNVLDDEQYRSPGLELVKCIFIPAYYLHWVYVTIKLLNKNLVQFDSIKSAVTFCLSITAFWPTLIIQDAFNDFKFSDLVVDDDNQTTNLYEEVEAYKEIYNAGAITEEEYKAKLKELV